MSTSPAFACAPAPTSVLGARVDVSTAVPAFAQARPTHQRKRPARQIASSSSAIQGNRLRVFTAEEPIVTKQSRHFVSPRAAGDDDSFDWDEAFKKIKDEKGDLLDESRPKTPVPGPPAVPDEEFMASWKQRKGDFKKKEGSVRPVEEETPKAAEQQGPVLPSSRELKAKGFDFYKEWQQYSQLNDLPDATNELGEAPAIYVKEKPTSPVDALMKALYKALYRAYLRLQAKFDQWTAPKPAGAAAAAAGAAPASDEIDWSGSWKKFSSGSSLPAAEGLRPAGEEDDGAAGVPRKTEEEERQMAKQVVLSIVGIAVLAGLALLLVLKAGGVHGGAPRPFS